MTICSKCSMRYEIKKSALLDTQISELESTVKNVVLIEDPRQHKFAGANLGSFCGRIITN